MDSKQFDALRKDLEVIRNLLALQLKSSDVPVDSIGKAMGVSAGRVSQIIGESRSKKNKDKAKRKSS